MITSKIYQRYRKPCDRCNVKENLTRHHVKDRLGYKTGKIIILCRKCHNNIERVYRVEGRIIEGITKKEKIRRVKQSEEAREIVEEKLLPFYAAYPKFKEIVKGSGFHG